MNTLLQANIFFFINSIFNVLLIILLICIIYYLVPILRDFREIMKKAKETSHNAMNTIDKVQDDLGSEARAVVRGVGRVISAVLPKEKK